MKVSRPALLLTLSSIGCAVPLDQRWTDQPLCKNVFLPIQTQTFNSVFPPYPNSTAPGVMYQYLASFNPANLSITLVKGTFQISATYCEPTVKVQGRNAIQVLVHGLSATKEYWNGYYGAAETFAGEYSWVAHAQSQGYSTLAIDSLGNGQSDHPDPVKVVQGALQVAILQKIISELRAGDLPCIPAYPKVVIASHSYGSVLSRLLAQFYPTTGADAYVLTAASNVLVGLKDFLVATKARSASVVKGGYFADLAPGYQAIDPSTVQDVLYPVAGNFDPKMLQVDIDQPHIFAVGEIAGSSGTTPTNFTGPVMVITGREDQIVCGNGNITALVPDCGVGPGSAAANLSALFPKSSHFESYTPNNSSHIINSQYSAPEVFGAAHAWLASVGF